MAVTTKHSVGICRLLFATAATIYQPMCSMLCKQLLSAGLVLVYYFMNAPMTAKASTLVSTTCAIGMMINTHASELGDCWNSHGGMASEHQWHLQVVAGMHLGTQ